MRCRDEVIGEGPIGAGGITVVGSYIERTSEQLAYVLSQGDAVGVRVGIDDALYETKNTVRDRSRDIENALSEGKDAILYLAFLSPYIEPGQNVFLTMLLYGIDDIRYFYQNDLRFLKQFS